MTDIVEPSDVERGGLPPASAEYMDALEALVDRLESRVLQLEEAASMGVKLYHASPGWYGFTLKRSDGTERQVEISIAESASNPLHLLHIMDAARREFADV